MLPVTYNTKIRARGFTLLELMIAIAISLVLAAGATAPVYGNLRGESELHDTTVQVKQSLRAAREHAVAGLGNSAHGVHIERTEGSPNVIVLYRGSTYDTRDAQFDQRITVPASLTISTTIDDDVSFSAGQGVPNTTGLIRLTNVIKGSAEVTISALGIIEEQ